MIKRLVAICAFVFGLTTAMQAQIDARMLRNPDVSETQIVFVYANDLWVVNKEGGTAARLSSPKGLEGFPKFSPDGKEIAFIGNYNGNNDIYTIPAKGEFQPELLPTDMEIDCWIGIRMEMNYYSLLPVTAKDNVIANSTKSPLMAEWRKNFR